MEEESILLVPTANNRIQEKDNCHIDTNTFLPDTARRQTSSSLLRPKNWCSTKNIYQNEEPCKQVFALTFQERS